MGSGTRPWLRDDGSERLFTLRLKGVDNPLDPDPLWDSTYGGGNTIYDSISNSSSRRLKEALNVHRKLSPEWDNFGFPIEKRLVFSDVVLWIPTTMWNSSSREGGERLFILSEKLKYRHRTEFEGELYKQRTPHYAIMPLKSLAPDEVVFQFGLGVYLPHKDDVQTAEVKIQQQGKKPATLPNWIFFEDQREIERPATLYAEQHFLLVANTLAESAIHSPYWFKQQQGYMMIDTHRQPQRTYGDDEYIEAGKITGSNAMTYCDFHALNEDEKSTQEQLKLIIHRKSQTDHKSASSETQHSDFGETIIHTNNNFSDDLLGGLTVISSDEKPIYRYRLAITGIILPSIQYPNIKHWLIHLNQQGQIANNDEKSQWIIRGNHQGIEWQKTDSDDAENNNDLDWHSLDTSQTLPFPEETPLSCRTAVLADTQYAILMLPQSLSFPLSHQSSRLGRSDDNDIALQLLNREDSIEWSRATRKKQSMGHLGLSAQHLSLSIEGHSLLVQQQSNSAPCYILQDESIVQTLEANSFSEATLSSKQELIVGNYLLQYTQEYIEDDEKV